MKQDLKESYSICTKSVFLQSWGKLDSRYKSIIFLLQSIQVLSSLCYHFAALGILLLI